MTIKDDKIRKLEEELNDLKEKFEVLSFHIFGTMSKKMKTPWTYELVKSNYKKNKLNEQVNPENGPREIRLD